ncbi:KDO2-lipid IV(A) lauroyltransferase [Andreprevotia lacus DSM 23236]|jgi:KDO2-lipid IV(A) lauroyltransferase|uniref:KDO2-lipid IV(A) lauroyltransferase n=1 Tax=Andreprevotia lacus DSM 23236 TaxID=1121001 RepID=A0A1W1XRD2_9NEIS|nr:hypothetical protein [Andreprevotia lacus]SMC26447.1 KDO2-lipid IV(A) lauroyltransferase [Andreprevotia lacus DSM 23236]
MTRALLPAPVLSWRARLLALPFRVLAWLPMPVLRTVAALCGELLYLLVKRRRQIGLVNMRICFPGLDDAAHRSLLRRHYRELVSCVLSYGKLWFGSARSLEKLVHYEGYEHYKAVHGKQPVILLAPHFLGLDAGGIRLSHDVWGCSMYSASHENPFDELLLAGRSRFGQTLLVRRNDGIRPIVKALRDDISFYYLPDQDLGPRESIFVPFFGVPTATVPAMGKLARLSGAAVVPMITTLEGNRFVCRFYPAWQDFPAGDDVVDTARMNAFIEAQVRAFPSQYYWLHRRFKTRPEGEAPFY